MDDQRDDMSTSSEEDFSDEYCIKPGVNQTRTGALPHYGVKEGNDPKYGKGACFIIANFTDDLQGYQQDAANIEHFHKTTLQWDAVFRNQFRHHSMNNLTKKQLFKLLEEIQQYLNEEENLDRFFLYILSHGDSKGILTCQEGSGSVVEKTTFPKKKKRVKMTEIVKLFYHDKVPSLKGFPKVFINQSCRGEQLAQAAFGASSPYNSGKTKKIPVEADTIVCYASSYKTVSWVSTSGSVFVRALLNQMTKFYDKEQFVDILTSVNEVVSQWQGGSATEVFQMPGIYSQLTKKFHLALP